jgi:hypothetical protein
MTPQDFLEFPENWLSFGHFISATSVILTLFFRRLQLLHIELEEKYSEQIFIYLEFIISYECQIGHGHLTCYSEDAFKSGELLLGYLSNPKILTSQSPDP